MIDKENSKNITILQLMLNKYFENDTNIQFAFAFGSRVKGKTRYMSDFDIAVYFAEEPKLPELGGIIAGLESLLELRIDIVVLNNLFIKNPELAYNIICEGRLVINRNDYLLTKFKTSVFLNYLDIKPMLEIQHNKFLERLKNNRFAGR
jgi:predicted nucleotidyltransferase